jgi:hypothetical protein
MGTKVGTGDGSGSNGGAFTGPTWADIRREAQACEEETGLRVSWQVIPADVKLRWRGRSIAVRCRLGPNRANDEGCYWGLGTQGGNGGSKTLPAAMSHALGKAWNSWWEDQEALAIAGPERLTPIEAAIAEAVSHPEAD